jgi:dTDP-4-dehydrorhamnose 3,5-epimerase-like enzyme
MSEADRRVLHGVADEAVAPLLFDDQLRPIDRVRVIDLPKISDPDGRGNLTFLEGGRHLPFSIKRVYYLYDVPGGESRGGHAHKQLQQFIVAASGSFEVQLDDGREKRSIFLNRSYCGVLVPEMIWRELHNFSSGSVCLVMASEFYDRSDYIYDYEQFLKVVRAR